MIPNFYNNVHLHIDNKFISMIQQHNIIYVIKVEYLVLHIMVVCLQIILDVILQKHYFKEYVNQNAKINIK